MRHLEYEAYPKMAILRMQEIIKEAMEQFQARVAIVHRVGTVLPNEISVVIAVATPHRGASL